MAYKWASWLPVALKKEGIAVITEPGYAKRGRYRADGNLGKAPNWDFEPNGLVQQHHTGVLSTDKNPNPTRTVLKNGRADLSGPLCHVATLRDGRVRVVALGRANHAGKLSGFGPTTKGADGNTIAIGNEIETNGTQKMPVKQYRAAIKVAAAVIRHKKRDASWMISHAEGSVTGKWDPGEGGKPVNMDKWRRDLKECLSYPPGIWYHPKGKAYWGEVDVSELDKGVNSKDKATIKRLQRRLKYAFPSSIPAAKRKAVKINGVWDTATTAALNEWQQKVFKPANPGVEFQPGGKRMGKKQAKEMFSSARYHLV